MSDVKNKSSTACKESEAMRKELRRTVQNYSKVIDMIDATTRFDESTQKPKESPSWRKLLKKISKHF